MLTLVAFVSWRCRAGEHLVGLGPSESRLSPGCAASGSGISMRGMYPWRGGQWPLPDREGQRRTHKDNDPATATCVSRTMVFTPNPAKPNSIYLSGTRTLYATTKHWGDSPSDTLCSPRLVQCWATVCNIGPTLTVSVRGPYLDVTIWRL